MKPILSQIGACLALLATSKVAGGQTHALTPKVGDPARKAVMDTLRVPVEKELKQKVIFKVSHLKLQNGWAFLEGEPMQPNGKRLNFLKTKYREAVQNGAFGGGIDALLHKTGGRWRVVTYRLGPTDVAWEGWNREYHAPDAIFPYTRGANGEMIRH